MGKPANLLGLGKWERFGSKQVVFFPKCLLVCPRATRSGWLNALPLPVHPQPGCSPPLGWLKQRSQAQWPTTQLFSCCATLYQPRGTFEGPTKALPCPVAFLEARPYKARESPGTRGTREIPCTPHCEPLVRYYSNHWLNERALSGAENGAVTCGFEERSSFNWCQGVIFVCWSSDWLPPGERFPPTHVLCSVPESWPRAFGVHDTVFC